MLYSMDSSIYDFIMLIGLWLLKYNNVFTYNCNQLSPGQPKNFLPVFEIAPKITMDIYGNNVPGQSSGARSSPAPKGINSLWPIDANWHQA